MIIIIIIIIIDHYYENASLNKAFVKLSTDRSGNFICYSCIGIDHTEKIYKN